MAAVSIMAVCCRASVLALCFLVCFLQVLIQGKVFLRAPQAHDVLLRTRRANMFLLEEFLQGNLERECFEELCNYEEAREYFEDTEKTISFWTVYYDGDQCESNPCLHGGNCTDRVGAFLCSCPAPYSGPTCGLGAGGLQPPTAPQVGAPEIAKCPIGGPTTCDQLCTASRKSYICSCMTGFKLQTDRHSCVPEGEFPCGRLPDPVTTSTCCHGNCPWQAWLLNSWGEEMCGGVVLGRHTILTSARCLLLDSGSARHTSTFFVVVGENRMFLPVRALHIHNRFRLDHHDNDLALLELAKPLHFGPSLLHLCLPTKDFSENILMHSGRTGVAGRRGGRQNQELVYMTLDECRGELSVSHPLSNKMFCMRRQTVQEEGQHEARGPAAGPVMNQNGSQNTNGRGGHQGAPIGAKHKNSSSENTEQTPSGLDGGLRMEVGSRRCNGLLPGSPVTTLAQGTAFLTGLLISPAGSDGLVFTKLSRYLTWIRPRLKAAEDRMMPQVNQYPEAR